MSNAKTPWTNETSRRRLLVNAVKICGAAGAAGALVSAGAAQAKVSQSTAGYQPTPKGAARCDNCNYWVAPNGCRMVDGQIAAQAWCKFYVKKP